MTRWRIASMTLASVVVAVATTLAQERPDFSGTWKIDRRASTITGRGNSPGSDSLRLGVTADSLVISQNDKTLTVEERYSVPAPVTVVYALDGRTVTNQIMIARPPFTQAPTEFTSRWKGNQLVSSLTMSVQGEAEPRRYEFTMSLGADGSLVVQHQAVGSANARILVFRK